MGDQAQEQGAFILYVDDEPTNRVVFEQTFGRRFPVLTAESGEAALEVLQSRPIGVLVTDQRMPGMTGNELLERVRTTFPGIIRMVITAYADLDPILRAVNDGLVARYILKPWVRQELEEMLEWGLKAYETDVNTQARLLATERLATLGGISAAVLHDVNQPLSYLFAGAERLTQLAVACKDLGAVLSSHPDIFPSPSRRQLGYLAEELPSIAKDMLGGCQHIRGLTMGVRELLHPKGTNGATSTDPLRSIRFTLEVCRHATLKARGKLDYEGPEELAPVAMGSTELAQTLINLVSNATQSLERKDPVGGQVTIRAEETDQRVRLSVVDNGPGMPEDVLQNIGKPFYSTRPNGTGLGVSQCRRLVEGTGGRMTVDSTVDVGTTVTLELPKADAVGDL